LRGTAIPFHFNNIEEFQNIIEKYGAQLAAVVMEPCRGMDPAPGFLEYLRKATGKCGALLIFDEITIGWKLCFGGAHLKFGVQPDLAIFAKALGNGHPIGAVIGTEKAMAGAHSSFISSTYWTESVGPVAALATLRKMKQLDVPSHIERTGRSVQNIWKEQGTRHSLQVLTGGYPCLANFRFDHPQNAELRTLFTQEMLKRGFLAGQAFFPTMAHTDSIIALYENAVTEVFADIALAFSQNKIKEKLEGQIAHSGFQRLI